MTANYGITTTDPMRIIEAITDTILSLVLYVLQKLER